MDFLPRENRRQIICNSFPKSGVTWLTRLLGDILNSPTGGSHPSEDHKEIAAEGFNRPGPFIIRKGHYRLKEQIQLGRTAIPGPHSLIPELITDEILIHIVRDPRDIIISANYHWGSRTLGQIIDLVCDDGLSRLPAWNKYIKQWQQIDDVRWIRYEDLHEDTAIHINRVLEGISYDKARLLPAIDRQSFSNRKKQIAKDGHKLYLGRDYNLRFLRRGIVGDWKNILSSKQNEYIYSKLGDVMVEFGYKIV